MTKSVSYRTAVCLATVLLTTSVGLSHRVRAQAPADYFPTADWRTSAPQDQQLNRKTLKRLVKRIRRNEIGGIDSLLIARNGYLVTEEYFHVYGRPSLETTSVLFAGGRWSGRISLEKPSTTQRKTA